MKKQLAIVFAGILIFTSCQKSVSKDTEAEESTVAYTGERRCAADEVLQAQIAADPERGKRLEEIEAITQRFINNPGAYRVRTDGVIEIPVVFNVLYKSDAQNVSEAQLNSQITVLNEDFAAANGDYNLAPAEFAGVRSGNLNIVFVRDVITVRKQTTKIKWSTNDAMKKNSQGGIDPTSPNTKLNIWVCNMGGGILGYAQFPGGPSATDGIVLDDNATGNTGTASAPYGLGRTATHEIGHWLNLRHIWGDSNCGNDLVGDTPIHTSSNGGCPAYPKTSTCGGTSHAMMTMNYMDYTYDACMYMFTLGQKSRIQATFLAGGGRNSFAQP